MAIHNCVNKKSRLAPAFLIMPHYLSVMGWFVDCAGLRGQRADVAQPGRIGFAVHIDDVELAGAFVHVIGKVEHRADDGEMPFLHFGGEFLAGSGIARPKLK